jgi:hypothetical protein
LGKKARLGLFFETTEIRRLIITAAARQGMSPTAYCTRAIEERLIRDGEMGDPTEREAFLTKMEEIRKETAGSPDLAAEPSAEKSVRTRKRGPQA